MRQLMFVRKGRLEWWDRPDPQLVGEDDAIVRPFVASRCDGDAIFLHNDLSTALRAGVATGVIDPMVCAMGARPLRGPFPYGHECIAEVLEVGAAVNVRVGAHVIVPWAISCGACATCKRGCTSKCERGTTTVSGYGFGDPAGGWGGMVCDRLRVPFANHMLVPVPTGIDPVTVASASDNIPDAWRTVGPQLARSPGAPVLVMGGHARSIGLYAAGIAVALGSSRVDYVDFSTSRLEVAASLGANPIQLTKRAKWLTGGMPVLPGGYPISVDASNSEAALRHAIRALSPGGWCTSVGFYFWNRTGLPLWQMYMNGSTFHIGLSNPSADLPAVLSLITSGKFDPSRITSNVAAWSSAAEAFLEPGTKVVVTRRPVLEHLALGR